MAAQGPSGGGEMHATVCVPKGGGSLVRLLQEACQTALGILQRLNVPGGSVADLVRPMWCTQRTGRPRAGTGAKPRQTHAAHEAATRRPRAAIKRAPGETPADPSNY